MYTTFSKALDELLGGGYQPATLMQAYGRTGSSKTTLCAYLPCVSIYKKLKEEGKLPEDGRFFVVDTDGGFDFGRFKQIAESHKVDYSDLSRRVAYFNPTTLSWQHFIVAKAIPKMIGMKVRMTEDDKEKLEKMKIEGKEVKPLFVTVDPICLFYRNEVLSTPMKFRASRIGTLTGLLDEELIVLRKIAVDYSIPVCFSSWIVSPIAEAFGTAPESPMIGGRSLGFIPKIIIELRIPSPGLPIREAYLFKHRGRPEGLTAQFRLTDGGIADI